MLQNFTHYYVRGPSVRIRRLVSIAAVAIVCGVGLAQAGSDPRRIDDPPVPPPGASEKLWQHVQVPLLPAGASLGALWTGSPGELYVWASEGQAPSGDKTALLPHSMLLHWSGLSWLSVIDVRGETGVSVYGTGTNDIYAATSTLNGAAKMYHFNGLGWTEQVLPPGTRAPAGAIDGAPNDVYFRANVDVLRYDGRVWQRVVTMNDQFAGALTYIARNEVYANCCTGHCCWNGGAWVHHDCGTFLNVGASWGMRGDAASARDTPSLHPAPLTMFSAGKCSFTEAFAVWQFIEDAPGAMTGEWVAVPLGPQKSAAGVSAGLPSLVPDPPEAPPGSGPERAPGNGVAVWGTSGADVYAAGVQSKTGLLYHFDGSTWNPLAPFEVMSPIADVWGAGPGDVWVSFTDGRLLHYTGGASRPNPEGEETGMAPVSPIAPLSKPAVDNGIRALATRIVSAGNGAVTLEYVVPRDGRVSIAAFDIAGRCVATIENGPRPAGTYQAQWNTRGLARGVYFCQVRAGAEAVSRRVVILD